MTHALELAAADLVRSLRYEHHPQYGASQINLLDGAYFNWDAEKGDVTLRVHPELGSLFSASAQVTRKPRWFSFNLSLNGGSLEPGAILGLVVEMQGCEGQPLPVFLRALQEGTLSDTPFANPLQGSAGPQVQTLLHRVSDGEALSRPSDFLTLVMLLPTGDFSLTLRNLTLFVVPPDTARLLATAPAPEAD